MKLLREVTQGEEPEVESASGPVAPEDGWNVGHLANHGILLSCEGFSMKLDIDQLNILFDLAEDGESGEVRDHKGDAVYIEVMDKQIVLSREGDKTYPQGVILDTKTLKEMGIEEHDDSTAPAEPETEGDEEEVEDEEQPDDDGDDADADDTMVPSDEDEELKEGIKRAFRRSGKKIKRGFRVTSGFRKGRVVANVKNAFKPRAKARTRMKLKVASRKKKIVRLLKARRTRMKPLSKRLVSMNKRVSGKK